MEKYLTSQMKRKKLRGYRARNAEGHRNEVHVSFYVTHINAWGFTLC